MRRYWLPETSLKGDILVISGEDYHHICVVCRQEIGSRFEILFNQQAFLAEITKKTKKSAEAKILESRQLPQLPKPLLHLAISLPKFHTLENVLEKAVELGVHSVHPFTSDFSFIKSKPKEVQNKKPRWQKIIQGATQQTGRGELMGLTEVRPLSVLLKEFAAKPRCLGILAFEGQGEQSLKASLGEAQDLEELWLFVGSEGGFSQADIDLFKDYKMLPVSLGSQVLRVETACVTLLSILKYELGQFA